MRKILFLALLLPVLAHATPFKGEGDSTFFKKKYYNYAGIQANLLLQQFISFNSNSSINTNPYLFSYVKNRADNGDGFVFGTGFNVSQNSSNDGVAAVTVENVNGAFRFGYEKKYLQTERFIPFWGVEIGFGGVYNSVTSQLNQSFNNLPTRVETTKYFFGPAFRGGCHYAFTKHILIGTEFFFNAQIAYSTVNTSSFSGGLGSSSNFIPFNIGFQAPTALFLVFRY